MNARLANEQSTRANIPTIRALSKPAVGPPTRRSRSAPRPGVINPRSTTSRYALVERRSKGRDSQWLYIYGHRRRIYTRSPISADSYFIGSAHV